MEHRTCFIGTLPGAWTNHMSAIPMGEVGGTIGYMGEKVLPGSTPGHQVLADNIMAQFSST